MKYTIPLRRELNKVPRWQRAQKAAKAVKKYLRRHVKQPVKVHKSVNQAIWARGAKNPPAKISVEVTDVKTKEEKYKVAHLEGFEKQLKKEAESTLKKIKDKVKPKKKEKKKEKKRKKKEKEVDYSSMTKAEVYDIAQELDVSGRSTMNKKELIKAVKKAEK